MNELPILSPATSCKRLVLLCLLLFPVLFSFAQAPVANFTSTSPTGCTPFIVNFTDQSTGTPTSWQWDLGNGSTSNAQNPSTFYTSAGTYTVRLTVTNGSGSNTITRTNYITVNSPPAPDFTSNLTSGCFPLRVQFTDVSLPGFGTITNWKWSFGTGDTSILPNPQYTYNSAGSFFVILTVTNSAGCSRTIVKSGYINVTNGVVADFNVSNPLNCKPPEAIAFTNTTAGPATLSYQWDFGDGNISTAINPSNNYTSAGPFTVRLIASSTQGCVDTIIKTNAVLLNNSQPVILAPDSACVNGIINFQNGSSQLPTTSLWNFGDGNTSAQTNPIKTYSAVGDYTVQLINQYATCNDTITKLISIKPRPVADFSTIDTISCRAPFTVNFTNQSTGALSYKWHFGDGDSSTQTTPVHIYTNTGNYTVRLISTNSSGCSDTLIRTNYVRIQTPVLSPLFSQNEGCAQLLVQMQANSTSVDSIVSWNWDFGNGNTSTLRNPSFTFDSGSYAIRLRIVTTQGCIDSTRFDSIRVGTKPNAAFSIAPNPQCAFQNVQFTDLTTGNANEWNWNFGNGGSSPQKNPLYTYNDTVGTFSVRLIAFNNRCADTATQTIQILPPVARFTYNVQCLVNKRQVNFVNESLVNPGATYSWNFGDGSPASITANPTHTYAALGIYTVTLTVTNGGCSHSVQRAINLVDELADFSATPLITCKNQPITFTSNGYIPANVTNYYWDFGDGSPTANTANATHSFANSGVYNIVFAVTDINGCVDTARKNNYILINGATANFSIAQPQICLGAAVSLTNTSTTDGTNAITNAVWHMGDGNVINSLSSPFTYTYTSEGTYSIKLVITDATGCTDSIIQNNIVAVLNPVAAFTADTLSCPGATIQFVNQSSGGSPLKTYTWNFGDGSPASTNTNPLHTYSGTGLYIAQLITSEPIGCADTAYLNIRIDTPYAAFTINDSASICEPFEARFTNTSTFAASYQWDFGDSVTSTATNPTHFYSIPGTYIVRLIAQSLGNCYDTTYQTIRAGTATGTLSYAPIIGCAPLAVNLQIRTDVPLTYTWDFGNGSTITTTDSNMLVNYDAGYYVPKVLIADQGGCFAVIQGIDTIKVLGSRPNFGVDIATFCDNGTVQFIDSTFATDTVTGYLWDFGDGTTSTSITAPSHTYTAPGLYNVTLTVNTINGCSNGRTKNGIVRVVPSPSISIIGDTSFCMPANVPLQGQWLNPDTSSISWQWNIDGQIFNSQNPPNIIRSTADTIFAQLIATNGTGCKDTTTKVIVVHPLPSVFAGNDTTICINTAAILNASGAQSYVWDVSPSLSCTNCTTTLANPTNNTQYFVTGTSQYGCVNRDSINVRVKIPFTVSISAGDTLCIGENIQLTAGGAENYSWAPPAGLSSTTIANPIATPTTTTTYTVTGFDSSNCFTDTRSVTVYVYNYPTINAGNDTVINGGTSAQLMAIGSPDIISYTWSPFNTLSCTSCTNPISSPKVNTTYKVEVSNIAGCTSYDEVTVLVGCLAGRIYIPNAFTPNNDGKNDRFFVIGDGVDKIKRIIVYDRWGKPIYSKENIQGNNPAVGWDGTMNGYEQMPGMYTYIAEVVCGDGAVFKMQGTITLIR